MASAAVLPFGLLRLPTELKEEIFTFVEDADILALRKVSREISRAAFRGLGTRFFENISVNPFTSDMVRLRWLAAQDGLRDYVRVINIQPFRHGFSAEAQCHNRRLREKEFRYSRWCDNYSRGRRLAVDLRDCLSRFPNAGSCKISDVEESGRAVTEDWLQQYPYSFISLYVLICAMTKQGVPVRELRYITHGDRFLPRVAGWSASRDRTFARSRLSLGLLGSLRILHICPMTMAGSSGNPFLMDDEFDALIALISASINLECLYLAKFDPQARRFIRRLSLTTPLPRLRKFVLTGSLPGRHVRAGRDEGVLSGDDLATLLGRLGRGGRLDYLYLSRVFLDKGLEDWKTVLRTVERRCCPSLRNFTMELCGSGPSLAYYCPVLETLRSRVGEGRVLDFCVPGEQHELEDQHNTVVVDEYGGTFEFVTSPAERPVSQEETAEEEEPPADDEGLANEEGLTNEQQGQNEVKGLLHEVWVRYNSGGSEARYDAFGNPIGNMAKALAAIRNGMYLRDRTVPRVTGEGCPGRPFDGGGPSTGSHMCGDGLLPNKDDQAWLDTHNASFLDMVNRQ